MTQSYFLIVRTDADDSAEKRLAAMDAHIKYTVENKHRFCVGGAIRHDPNADALGSAMIIQANSLENARAFASLDPFDKTGVYARTDVWQFNVGVGEWLPEKLRKF
ncbi:YciI family protein [Litorimonas sp.]|uniref:YciI family protein n=1 Tax=Litorimonas sp. TaxID=1892381 RepID=UPI003A8A2CAF